MHALLVTAHVEPGSEEEGWEYLRTNVLPQLKHLPGLRAGYWLATTKEGESLAVLFFENEDSAQKMAQNWPSERPSASRCHAGRDRGPRGRCPHLARCACGSPPLPRALFPSGDDIDQCRAG